MTPATATTDPASQSSLSFEEREAEAENLLKNFQYLDDLEENMTITDFDYPIHPEVPLPTDQDQENDDFYYHEIFYRKITNFMIMDVFGYRMKDFFKDDRDPSQHYLITGELVASNPTRSNRSEAVKIVITTMFYNFGVEYESGKESRKLLKTNRMLQSGFWVRDVGGIYYQLIAPAEAYQKIYDACTGDWGAKESFHPKQAQFGRQLHLLENYSLVDEKEQMIDLIKIKEEQVVYALGQILFYDQIETSVIRRLQVRIPFHVWEISLCQEYLPELNHGICINNLKGNLWFKLASPLPIYQETYALEKLMEVDHSILATATKPNKLYRGKMRTLTHFEIIDYEGNILNQVPEISFDPNTPHRSYYALSGLLSKSKRSHRDICRIRIFVKDFIFDMGYKEEDDVTMVAIGIESSFYYRLEWSPQSKFPEFNSILDDYNWPSEEGEIWRRIIDYYLMDINGKYVSLITKEEHTILKGKIILPDDLRSSNNNNSSRNGNDKEDRNSHYKALKVQVYCEGYSIDFGNDPEDDNRGLWLQDYHGNWFKVLQSPYPGYAKIAEEGLMIATKFLQFHAVLVHSESPEFTEFDGKDKYICRLSIQELYQQSKGSFDLQFIATHKDFVFDNIGGIINEKRSKVFWQSIEELTRVNAAAVMTGKSSTTSNSGSTPEKRLLKPQSTATDMTKKTTSTSASLPSSRTTATRPSEKAITKPSLQKGTAPITHQTTTSKRSFLDVSDDEPTEDGLYKCPFCKSLLKSKNCPMKEHINNKFLQRDPVMKPIKRKTMEPEGTVTNSSTSSYSHSSSQPVTKRPKVDEFTPSVTAGPPPVHPFRPKLSAPKKPAGSIFCSHCKALAKSSKCQNPRHINGLPLQLSRNDFTDVGGQSLCPHCHSLRKNCDDDRHINGHYYQPKKPSVTTTSQGGNKAVGSGGNTTEREFDVTVLKQKENYEKEKYLVHHHHQLPPQLPPLSSSQAFSRAPTESAEALAARIVPLGRQLKHPMERLKESTMTSRGVFGPPAPKHVPQEKHIQPEKPAIKYLSETISNPFLSSSSSSSKPKRRVHFADEGGNNAAAFEQRIYYSPEPSPLPYEE